MTLFPEGLAAWRDFIGVLSVIGIVYGALVALVQRDFKFVVGFSSVSHMGLCSSVWPLSLPSSQRCGPANVFARHPRGTAVRCVGRMVYDREPPVTLMSWNSAGLAGCCIFRRRDVSCLRTCVDGSSRLQRICWLNSAFSSAHGKRSQARGDRRVGIIIGVAYTLRAIQKGFTAVNSRIARSRS